MSTVFFKEWFPSQEKTAERAAWLQGKDGGFQQVFSKTDGQNLAEYKLACLPAFDGLIAASGSSYVVTKDGG